MTISVQALQATTMADLKTAIDAYLATFVAGASRLILGIDVVQQDQDRQLGKVITVIITTDDAGAAAQTDPYVFQWNEAGSASALTTALQTAITALGAIFITGVRNVTEHTVPKLNRLTGWFVSCADATNGPTNWTPK